MTDKKLRITNIRGTVRFIITDDKGHIVFACNGRKAAQLYVDGDHEGAALESNKLDKIEKDPELPKPSPYVLKDGKIVRRWSGLLTNQELFYLISKKQVAKIVRVMRPYILVILNKLRADRAERAILISISDQALLRRVNRKIRKHIKSFDYRCKFTTWVYPIVLNTFRDQERKDTPLEDKVDHIHFVNEHKRWFRLYYKYIDRLGYNFKGIFLKYMEGMPYKYIANRYKLNVNTIKTRIHRVKDKLLAFEDKDYREQKLRYIFRESNTPLTNPVPEELRTKRKDINPFPRWTSPYPAKKKQ